MNQLKSVYLFVACMLFAALSLVIASLVFNIGDPTTNSIERTHAIYLKSSYWVDEQSTANLSEALNQTFQNSEIRNVPWQFGTQTYWLKVSVTNRTEYVERLTAHFDNPMLDQLEIWQLDDNNNIVKHKLLGDTLPNLNLHEQAFPHFNFTLNEKESSVIVTRIKTTGITKTPLTIYQADNFNSVKKFSYLIWGLFIGVTVMIALYNLILFISIRETVYLAYIGYILSTLMMMGSVLGFGYYIWPTPMQNWLQVYVVSTNFSVAICALIFGSLFLRYATIKTKLNALIKGTLAILLIGGVSSFFLPEYYAAPVFFVCMVPLYITILLIVFNRLLTDFVWAKYYFFSWLPLIVSGAVQPLVLVGVLEHTFLTRHAFLIGVLLEVLLMAMALADKFSHQQRESYFKATHDSSSQLPNETLYKYKITQLIEQQQNFITCFIELKNFGQFIPYMAPKAKKDLVNQVYSSLQPVLINQANIIMIEEQGLNSVKLAYLRDGVFALLLNHGTNRESLNKLLHTLQSHIPTSLLIDGILLNLSSHIATCSSIYSNQRSGLLLRKTWQTLFQAKQEGVALLHYKKERGNDIGQQFNLASELHCAIEEKKLTLNFTPVYHVKTKKLIAITCQFSWPHPEFGQISQQEIIKLAIDTGLNVQLNRWLFSELFSAISTLKENGVNCKFSLTLSLNQLNHSGFIGWLSEQVTHFDTDNIMIYTQHPVFDEQSQLQETLQKLLDLGFKFGLDNFHGDLDRLFEARECGFSDVRIGHLFTKTNIQGHKLTLLLSAMVDVAKGLDLSVTAIGVDNQEFADIVNQCQCDYMQGELLAPTMNFRILNSFLLAQQSRIGNLSEL
ncbi:EAL domain-containing protein [Pseudoalteromonas sp. G4]|uniref:EAL domain-containing protein n=1 Tax=Pseudoalteromonas sp. G4 TaxID=2992761 RepID=UPI00237EE438|nr:EAL domain-containing protein [Pseudoalteromonas sp. G4]MDE3272259.1 EAL domain-containing protein [Pseudoalteromonas sp. G4]